MRVSFLLAATLALAVSLSPARAEPAAATDAPASSAAGASPTPPADASPAGVAVPAAATTPSGVTPAAVSSTADPAPADGVPNVAPAVAASVAAGNEAAPSSGVTSATAAEATPAAAAEPPPPPEPTLVIDINLSTQRMNVSENGAGKYTWAISSAAPGYRTPTGTFKPVWMSRMWYSRQYDYSPMPHSIFFHNGVAIHATQAIRHLGRPASHGCVRLAPSNAATLYKLVGKHGKAMTKIVVHGSPKYRPTVAYSGGTRNGTNARRRQPAAYGYYGSMPSYYVPAQKRRAYTYQNAKPRRYVSRGVFQSGY